MARWLDDQGARSAAGSVGNVDVEKWVVPLAVVRIDGPSMDEIFKHYQGAEDSGLAGIRSA